MSTEFNVEYAQRLTRESYTMTLEQEVTQNIVSAAMSQKSYCQVRYRIPDNILSIFELKGFRIEKTPNATFIHW